jgi:hypothetical protein
MYTTIRDDLIESQTRYKVNTFLISLWGTRKLNTTREMHDSINFRNVSFKITVPSAIFILYITII